MSIKPIEVHESCIKELELRLAELDKIVEDTLVKFNKCNQEIIRRKKAVSKAKAKGLTQLEFESPNIMGFKFDEQENFTLTPVKPND